MVEDIREQLQKTHHQPATVVVFSNDKFECGWCHACFALSTLTKHWTWCLPKNCIESGMSYDAALAVYEEQSGKRAVRNTEM
jgi:hypothetical protein